MKTFRLFAAVLFAAALFSVSAFAQTTAVKIGVINTTAFDDAKGGITKYTSAMNMLENEFKPVNTELQTMVTKYQNMQKEIQNLQEQIAKPNSPIPQSTLQSKIDEYGKLERDIKFRQEDAKARFTSRQGTLLAPVLQDIGKAIQEFSKQKGYTLILDIAKMAEGDLILALDEKADVTKEFIIFYNARPAGTASAVAPK
ncbi:MAG: OmpH family outer membrane protein [Pyrinomonadaceae bacterium]